MGKERASRSRRRRPRRHPTARTRETAALHALGILTDAEAKAFEAHVADGCTACAEDAAAFRETLTELGKESAVGKSPPPELRRKLLERAAAERGAAGAPRTAPRKPGAAETQVWRLWKGSAGGEGEDNLRIVRAEEGSWEKTAVDGVSVKPLAVDPERRYVTMLVRMEPGSSYPIHEHAGAEECYVLEGDLDVGGEKLHAGDYQRAGAGSRHRLQSTEKGCLLLIVSSQDDELL
jgi:anti-sigma factor ChrR (cupin superfamily)